MFVRQLIGSESGKILEMPTDVALGCVRQGTAELVTQDQVLAELTLDADSLAEGEVPVLDPLAQALLRDLQAPVEPVAAAEAPVASRGRKATA